MNALSEMYPVFESPYPTLLTHTDNGLGIFVAHPKVELRMENIGAHENMFRVACGTALDFHFPLKEHARVLLASRGGVIAFTDETGMPWYTFEMQPVAMPANAMPNPGVVSRPKSAFGRPLARSNSPKGGNREEGDFSI